MTVEEMNFYVFQHLMTLADSYSRASAIKSELEFMKNFAVESVKETTLLKNRLPVNSMILSMI